MRQPLNPRQQATYDAVLKYWRYHSYAPAFIDLESETTSKGHTQRVVSQLVALDYLDWRPNVARSIVPVDLSYADLWQRVLKLELLHSAPKETANATANS